MSLPKPLMRGLLARRLKIHMPIAFGLAAAGVLFYKYGVAEPRKRAYDHYYETRDMDKEGMAMLEGGVFQYMRTPAEMMVRIESAKARNIL